MMNVYDVYMRVMHDMCDVMCHSRCVYFVPCVRVRLVCLCTAVRMICRHAHVCMDGLYACIYVMYDTYA